MKKRCGNCRWYVPQRRWCRMMGVEHDKDDPGGWWHEWADKAKRIMEGGDDSEGGCGY